MLLKVIKERVDYTERDIKEYSTARTDIEEKLRIVPQNMEIADEQHFRRTKFRTVPGWPNLIATQPYTALLRYRMSKFLSGVSHRVTGLVLISTFQFGSAYCQRQALQVGNVPRVFLLVFPTHAPEIVENKN